MAWNEDIQTPLIITTGEGSQFINVLWKNNCVKELDFNIAEFDFPNVPGSYVNRAQPRGRKFSFDIYFQGDDHLDTAQAFEKATLDPRPWKVVHPIYKSILVQPSSLKFDYSGFSVTQVTGTLLETIEFGVIKITESPRNTILFNKQQMDERSALNYEPFTPGFRKFKTVELELHGLNKLAYDLNTKVIALTEDFGNFTNTFNASNSAITSILSSASDAMSAIQTMWNYPAQFVIPIKERIKTIQNTFDQLTAQTMNLGDSASVPTKINYQKIGNALVGSMAVASVTSYDANGELVDGTILPDYTTKDDVLNVITALQYILNQYLSALDSIQSDNGGDENSFVPNADDITNLINLINFTITNLYAIALSSKSERIIILEKDSNIVLLAHRFYGLQPDDSTIDFFMKTNNILLDEYLQIKKGRTLKFYI